MKKLSIVLLIVIGMFTSCSSLGVSPSRTLEKSNPFLGTWVNVNTYMYEGKEETATNTLNFEKDTFFLNTVVNGEDYTEYTSEEGEYTYTDTTLVLTYSSHTNAEGESFYGEELLVELLESLTIVFGYSITESDSTTTLSIEGQLFTKQ